MEKKRHKREDEDAIKRQKIMFENKHATAKKAREKSIIIGKV